MVQAAVKAVETVETVKHVSLDDFLAIPETEPESEYFDCEIIQKPMPKGKHSAIQTEFAAAINLVKKVLFALEHGTEMAWLVDPDEELIFIYRPNQALQMCDRPEHVLPSPSFAIDLQLTVATIFGWLSE
jgi:Uma2 family endonuclease